MIIALCLIFAALQPASKSWAAEPPAVSTAAAYGLPALSREDFNRLAASSRLPLYWQLEPSVGPLPSPGALAPVGDNATLEPFVADGQLTDAFEAAYRRLVEARRLEAVRKELDQGFPVVIINDFRQSPPEERSLAAHLSAAAKLIDELYLAQKGGLRYVEAVRSQDSASRALFERNHGPWCEAPATEADPFCSALPSFPKRLADAYPLDWQQDAAMCDSLRASPDGKTLLDPFTVVRESAGRRVALPLDVAYGADMRKVASELRAAADALGADERPFKAYLLAAAQGFESNDWSAADEAWVALNGRNSRWYLRVAPDETGVETCQEKAGFQMSWARIDKTALAWQDKLAPLRQEMEDLLAGLIGEPYKARKVAFNLPDFIEVILNAGDSRMGIGAIIGETLPNWGKSADRRRTLVMTNMYSDPDSRRLDREKAAALLDSEALQYYPADDEPGIVGTILHEATHNLGPHSDTKLNGKTMAEVFGGRLETVLEELKAQTGALWYVELLRRKGLLSDARARQIYAHEIVWAFSHISEGMFTEGDNPRPYSQLAAVQIGSFLKDGAMSWVKEGDKELYRVDFARLPASVEALMRKVGRLRAAGDAAAAKAFVDDFVSGEGSRLLRADEVERRLRKFPKPSFAYTVLY
jgi:hypothetical protein